MQRDYIYQRGGVFFVRFTYPLELAEKYGKEKKRSLKTRIRVEAEARAAPLVAEHKRLLLEVARRRHQPPLITGTWLWPLGISDLPDGNRVFADETRAVLMRDGRTEEQQNGVLMVSTSDYNADDPPTEICGSATKVQGQEMDHIHPVRDARYHSTAPSLDDLVLETYLADKRFDKHDTNDARIVWKTFRDITGAKPLAKCTIKDGRLLMHHLEKQTSPRTGKLLSTKTIRKKLCYLSAAVNHGLKTGEYMGPNPFRHLDPQGQKASSRLPLTDIDMLAVAAHLKPGSEEHLLWLLLSSTGMRVSEAFVTEEFNEGGIRYIMTGSKNRQSIRRVPLPSIVTQAISKIEGPLFRKSSVVLAKSLGRIMDKAGVTDPRKCVHSLRHRAKDQLRIAECPLDIQHQLLGHEVMTVASRYGLGYPLHILAPWIDRITPSSLRSGSHS